MTTTTPPAPGQQITRAQQQRMTLRKLFEQQKPELVKLLPKGMTPERLERMALTECVKNPDLLECSAESWALAMQTCAAQGLYPDSGLGFMYLIPRNVSRKVGNQWIKRMEVQAQRGYQGDIALARKSGELADIYAEVVYEKDEYRVTKGLNRDIVHIPYDGDDDPGALKACYAVAKLKSGEVKFVTLSKRDVERHRLSSQTAERDDGPWKKHTAAMWKKTAVHELFKWLPKSSEDMERVVAAITDRPIDTTAIDLGRVELPAAGDATKAGLDAAADRLESAGGPPADAAEGGSDADEAATGTPLGCAHPKVPPSEVKPGSSVPCPDCGEVLQGEPVGREPGSDDGDPDPREAVKAVAAAAQQTQRGPQPVTRQGRLSE